MAHRPVSVSRHVAAPASAVFELLVDPRRHPEVDGSGMLQSNLKGPERLALGDSFSTSMKAGGVPYRVTCVVSELVPDRRIAWQPWMRVGGVKLMGGVTWRWELDPDGDGTKVTETYDVTTGRLSRLFALAGFPTRMQAAMTKSIDNVAALVEA
jgi:uncharacterized protein YndB with AHSA1/START domain